MIETKTTLMIESANDLNLYLASLNSGSSYYVVAKSWQEVEEKVCEAFAKTQQPNKGIISISLVAKQNGISNGSLII